MKVLTIDYPKEANDEKKLAFLNNSYNSKLKMIVAKE